jgi:hypothetical protein
MSTPIRREQVEYDDDVEFLKAIADERELEQAAAIRRILERQERKEQCAPFVVGLTIVGLALAVVCLAVFSCAGGPLL